MRAMETKPHDKASLSPPADPRLTTASSARRPNFKPAIILAILLVAFATLECLLPLHTAIQIGADEGFNLAKATLCLKGFKLYAQVWNDQPPLHTFLITQLLKHVSPSVLGPRLVTVAFAALLLGSLFILALRLS